MSDRCVDLLLQQINDDEMQWPAVLFADEHFAATHLPERGRQLTILSNRFDVYQSLSTDAGDSHFSDFDAKPFPAGRYASALFRVSKEKPVVFHVINACWRLLKENGTLVLTGEKGDGLKNYADRCANLYGTRTHIKKFGNAYLARISKQSTFLPADQLDDRDYPQIRAIGEYRNQPVYSKPGVFGWNKFDQGSQLLIQVATQQLQNQGAQPTSVLDLGCGYGYLTIATQGWQGIRERCATDNNAAALQCIRANCDALGMDVDVVASDAGMSIDRSFDLILCNPPFHQGFKVDSDLTRKFLQQAQRLLNKGGRALFVVNQFIGLEALASRHFSSVTHIHKADGFKVIELRR